MNEMNRIQFTRNTQNMSRICVPLENVLAGKSCAARLACDVEPEVIFGCSVQTILCAVLRSLPPRLFRFLNTRFFGKPHSTYFSHSQNGIRINIAKPIKQMRSCSRVTKLLCLQSHYLLESNKEEWEFWENNSFSISHSYQKTPNK